MIEIDNLFLMAFIGLAICVFLLSLLKKPFKKTAWFCGIYAYITIVLGLTLCPIPIQGIDSMAVVIDDNFIPFVTIVDCVKSASTETALIQIGGNIAMSVPCGMLSYLLVRKKRSQVIPLCIVLFPALVEGFQFLLGFMIGIRYRSFDVDDILLGIIGGAIGYCMCIAGHSITKRIKSKREYRK